MEVKGVSWWPESAHSMYMYIGISFTPTDNCKIKMGSTWSLSYKISTGGAAGEIYIFVYYYLYSESWSELANALVWQDGLHTWWPFSGSSSGGASKNHYNYYTLNYNILQGNTYHLVVYFKVWMQGNAQLTSQTGSSHCVLEIQSIAYVQT